MTKKLIAATLATCLLAAGFATGAAASSGRLFHPDQKLSKGWFGVLTYKFIRDEIPGGADALKRCDSGNRFDDLGGESEFKRKALNCLADLGYFDGVPAPAPPPATASGNTGDWERFEGSMTEGEYVGYILDSESWSVYSRTSLILRCGLSSRGADGFYFNSSELIFNDYSADTSPVKWRITPGMGSARTERNWWSNEKSDSAVFGPRSSGLLRRLKTTHSGTLLVSLYSGSSDLHEQDLTFDVTGASNVLAALDCF